MSAQLILKIVRFSSFDMTEYANMVFPGKKIVNIDHTKIIQKFIHNLGASHQRRNKAINKNLYSPEVHSCYFLYIY